MIWESFYWKEELRNIAARLSARQGQKRWPDRSFYLLEKDMFFVFFAIRKLTESKKITDKVRKKKVSVVSYPALGKKVTYLRRGDVEECYDVKLGKNEKLSLVDVCNLFIHSFNFQAVFSDGRLKGFFVTSDYRRRQSLVFIEIGLIIRILKQVSQDYPSQIRLTYDSKIDDYKVSLA